VVTGGNVVIQSSVATGTGLEIASGAGVTLETPNPTALASLTLSPGGILRLAGGSVSIPAATFSPRDLRSRLTDGEGGVRGIAVAQSTSLTWRVGWRYEGDQLTLAPAIAGDVNLDGVVDIVDIVGLVSSGAYNTSAEAEWSAGDSNHDGVVDVLDITEILQGDAYDRGAYGAILQATMRPDGLSAAALAFASFESSSPVGRSPRFAR